MIAIIKTPEINSTRTWYTLRFEATLTGIKNKNKKLQILGRPN